MVQKRWPSDKVVKVPCKLLYVCLYDKKYVKELLTNSILKILVVYVRNHLAQYDDMYIVLYGIYG